LKKNITKRNNIINKVSENKFFPLAVLMFFILIYRIIYFSFMLSDKIIYDSDSVSYFARVDLFRGVIDLYRTPIYPYIISFFRLLSKDNFIKNLITFQHIISFISIVPFYYVMESTVKNKYISYIATIFYGTFYLIVKQDININPECLSAAGSILFIYLICSYTKKPGAFVAFMIGILTLFLIMLKPIFLICLVIVPVFFIARFITNKKEKKLIIWGLIGWLIAVLGICSYCGLNYRLNGEFVLTKVALNNSLANVILSGAYLYGEDDQITDIINQNKNEWYYKSVFLINNEYMDNFKTSYKRFPKELKANEEIDFCLRTFDNENISAKRIKNYVIKSQHSATHIRFMIRRFLKIVWVYKILFLIIFFETAVAVSAYRVHRKIAWILSLSVLFISGQFFTIALGGIDEWHRLLIPSYPFIFLTTGMFFKITLTSINYKKLLEAVCR